ncbi:protein phosphatase [Propioniciclava sinopodophylli]|uniref:Protein phosphatase n=1 Tax=Propioniciclava sinopodophylli TaxID=1837344 RepID=A0A4Q9KDS3_9ACTN|nr:protein phosphatase 2C domain-containing protein [Propioniciclava sinopodophylli]TBT85020.1 protein phosphatase [Propioniciclava sinopodophylli]
MALTLGYDSHSEIGLVRSNNQDSAYTSPHMLMVADGMGGAAAGDLASAVATWELRKTDESLADLIAAARAERLAAAAEAAEESAEAPADIDEGDDPGDLVDVLTVMAGALARTNDRLVELVEDDPELAGMGTTVCGFVLDQDRLAVVNIGDSRAYLVRDGALHRVTRDHSWVQTLVDEGRITEEEALNHPHRSLVLRVLNGSSQHEPDLGWLDVTPGDRLLVCSDGLCGLVTDAAIASVATAGLPRTETIEKLVDLAHRAGGYDNITLIVADVEADGTPGPVSMIGAAAIVEAPTGAEHTATITGLDADADVDGVADERAITEDERYALSGRRRASTWVKLTLAILLPVLALAGGAFGWYSYTQTRYFIGESDANVALYRGVPDRVLGLDLSTLLETDTTRIADLPPYYAAKVNATIGVADLPSAQSTLIELREKANQCIAQREARARATAVPTPAPTPTASVLDPSGAPTPGVNPTAAPVEGATATPTPEATPSPTPSATPVTAPEEC